jgi:hypothetical protein
LFVLPEHGERLPLRVVLDAGQMDQRSVVRSGARINLLDEITTLPYGDNLAGFRNQ